MKLAIDSEKPGNFLIGLTEDEANAMRSAAVERLNGTILEGTVYGIDEKLIDVVEAGKSQTLTADQLATSQITHLLFHYAGRTQAVVDTQRVVMLEAGLSREGLLEATTRCHLGIIALQLSERLQDSVILRRLGDTHTYRSDELHLQAQTLLETPLSDIFDGLGELLKLEADFGTAQ